MKTDSTNKLPKLATGQEHTEIQKPEQTQGKRKKLPGQFIVLAIVLVILVILGLAWFLQHHDTSHDAAGQKTSKSATPASPNIQKRLSLYAAVYSHEVQGANLANGCAAMQPSLLWKPLSGGEATTTTANVGAQNYLSLSGVYKTKVFAVTDPGCGSADGAAIWYSADSGKTYNKLFAGSPLSNDQWGQITSAKFSTSGDSLIFAYLPAGQIQNTVKKIDLTTKAVTDLFTVRSPGVFVEGYNSTTNQLLYYQGCYNCDGNRNNKLYAHNVAENTDTVLFDDAAHITAQTAASSTLSKIMLVKGIAGDFMEPAQPYTVEEFDVASKTSTVLATINDNVTVLVGYRDNDGTRYYAYGDTVYAVNAGGTALPLFTSSTALLDIFYLGSNRIITGSGDYAQYQLTDNTISTKAKTTIMTGDGQTKVFGVSQK